MSRRGRFRWAGSAGLALALAACDPAHSAGIALAPRPELLTDSVRRAALELGARVAAQHELTEIDPGKEEARWDQCWMRDSFSLCGRATDQEVQFRLFQYFVFRFTPMADSVRRELADSLRSEFGAEFVHDCDWTSVRDRQRSTRWHTALRAVCEPLARRKGTEQG